MAKSDKHIAIAVVGFDGCSAWITAGLVELFAIANVAIDNLPQRRGADSPARFDCHVVTRSARRIKGSHGVRFDSRAPGRRFDAIIVPPIWCESREDLERRATTMRSTVALLTQLARRASIVASACSGALLLGKAGLLANRRATTCWWLADALQRYFPDTQVMPDQLVMRDGNLWTAAAGAAYIHLGLELVREFAGPKASAATARLMLVERRRGSQSPFMSPGSLPRQGHDGDVERAIRYLDANAAARITIASACRAISTTERTLNRKFQASLGMSPLTYLQSQRIAHARKLLENTGLPLERIVERCGYEDISSFRKLFARHVGMTPREYRSRFSAAPAAT